MWFLVALFVVSLVASLLLTPKPKFENARASTLDDLSFPRAGEGAPVPLLLGRVMMRGPNTCWAGDFQAVAIKVKQKTGLFSSKKVIVGYTYYIGLQMGLALGPCTLHSIISDKETLWEGTADQDGQVLNINLPDLYGGKEKGGGFISKVSFYTGSETQGVNAYLEGKNPGLTPAYRGFCYIVFEKANIGESNSLRSLAMEMSRYTNGLGLAGGMHMIGMDMNPMETLYQAFTLDWGGLDVTPDLLDLPSLRAAAQVLFNEANGMSVCVSTTNAGKDIANEVLRQVDGLMYQDPITGKMVMKLIRNDYNIDDLPVFDESNIIVIRSFTSKLWEDTVNQVRVNYNSRANGYKTGTAITQDLANINAQERVRSITMSYPAVTEPVLATELASRDLSQGSVPLLSASIEMNREGSKLRPGDPFLWAWGDYGLKRVVMRVKNFDLGALNDNRVAVECNQDDFAIAATVFAPPGGSGSGVVKPPTVPVASAKRMVTEAAYFFAQAGGVAITSAEGVLVLAAAAPEGSDDYNIYTSEDGTNYSQSETGVVYSPVGVLSAAITVNQNIATGVIPTLVITTDDGDDLDANTADEAAQGYGLFYIDQELFAHEGLVKDGTTVTLSNVRRALLDTNPTAHAAGASVWFVVGDNIIEDPMPQDGTVRVKVTPKTITATLAVEDAPYDTVSLNNRANRPLRPANVRFDGAAPFAPPANGAGLHTVTWANRDRTSLVLRTIADPVSENEAGQQTVFRYRKNGGEWVQVLLAPGVVTCTFDAGAVAGNTVDYEIYSTRDGLDSYSRWSASAGAASAGGAAPIPGDENPDYTAPDPTLSREMTTSEAIVAHAVVNIWNSSGAKVRNATAATAGKEANGYVKAAAEAGATVEVFFDGENAGLSGLTPGVLYLSDVAGQVTSVPPAGAGKVVQRVGTASDAGVFVFEPGEPIGLA
jgi:hypothetical protein